MYKDYTLEFFIYPSSFASNISHNNINRGICKSTIGEEYTKIRYLLCLYIV